MGELDRRRFLKSLGGGIAVLVTTGDLPAQEARRGGRGGRGEQPRDITGWLHIAEDGTVTVYAGKAEMGQNPRTSLAQAAAEELKAPFQSIRMVVGDTDLTPFDQGTSGSRTTPLLMPVIRRAAATAREMLLDLAAEQWKADRAFLVAEAGKIRDAKTGQSLSFGQLTKGQELLREISAGVALTPPAQWQVSGKAIRKITGPDLVSGKHQYPSDIRRPGMLYGKVLRAPAFNATLASVDVRAAEAMPGVTVVRDGGLIGVVAPSTPAAARAAAAIQAEWNPAPAQPSNADLFQYLKKSAGEPGRSGGPSGHTQGSMGTGLAAAAKKLSQTYTVAYIAHAPLEPRAAVAEWNDGKLTVWTGSQQPFGIRRELAAAFSIPEERVRVIIPDPGGGYGGKHSGEAAIEAARLAKAAGRPVKLIWTREEEFTWAYFRPAGVIEVSSGISAEGLITAWEFHNYNSGAAAIRTYYEIPNQRIEYHPVRSPLRQGSYRALAATANQFARETHMDELAHLAGSDPLAFRLHNLTDPRLRAVFQAAAERFGWGRQKPAARCGFGIGGGFEKGSYVATCAEVEIGAEGKVAVKRIVTAFECGAVVNPDQLKNQIEGMAVMALGGALFEQIRFENGRILNPRLSAYRLPRFSDLPKIEAVLVDRKDLPSAGAGETPITAVAPAIGNAIFQATGIRLRSLPLVPKGLPKRGSFAGIILVVLLLLSVAARLSGQAAQKADAAAKAAATQTAAAQKQAAKPAQKAQPPRFLEPPQPFIAYVFPAGGQRGQTVEIDASGTNLVSVDKPEENAVRVTGGGITARVIEAKEPNKARVAVAIAPDAELGEREIRFVNPGGISNRFRFFVGQLPEIKEVEPNSEKDKPQRIAALPVVVNGQVMESDRDYFRFSAKAGQTIVFAVQARRILPYIADAVPGWFDACLALYDSSGKELKYADDFRFNPDPLMSFNVPRDGEYTIEIRDIIYRGRGDFVYRLAMGELPYLTHIFPLGGAPNSETPVELYGVNLPVPRLNFKLAPDAPRVNYVSVTRNGVVSNTLPFAAGHYREVREAEPNDSLERAQRAEPPCVINGRIQKPGDADYFVFSAPKAGQRLVFEVQARRLDSPLDSIITLFNPRGDPAAENDDWVDPLEPLITHHADSRLVFTFPSSGPAAGQYVIRIRDAQGNGGEEYAYRLIIAPPQPDFVLRITPDNFRVGQGDTTGVTITAVKLDGFDGDIGLSVEGLPAGFVASYARIPAGQTEARLTLTAPPDAAIGVLSPVIVGTAAIGNATVARKAIATELVMQAFAWTYNVPARQLFLAVLHATAYKLSAEVPSKVLEIPQESEVPIVVKVLRKEGVKGGVSLSAPRPANSITVKAAFVAPDKDEGTLTVSVAKDAPVGLQQNIMISGAMRTGRETITRFLPAIPIKVVAAQQAAAKQ